MSKVIVIGGGASGMMAAYSASMCGHCVTLIEKNEKLGKKIYITGKGRCNFTNDSDVETLLLNVVRNPKFLYSAFYTFDAAAVIDFFETHGMKTMVERGNRAFPASDHSSDVIRTLERALRDNGVEILLNTEVKSILSESNPIFEPVEGTRVVGVKDAAGKTYHADAVIVATGGLSYATTGSTGDGYRFAKEYGHKIKETSPSLVPLNTKEEYVKELMGLSLKNVELKVVETSGKGKEKVVFSEQGEMLFTHFGISGPLVLTASAKLNDLMRSQNEVRAYIDLKPALSVEKLEKRILRDWDEIKNRQFKNSLKDLLPTKMIPVVIGLSGIDEEKKINEITSKERGDLVRLLKSFPLTITGLRGYEEAVITKGGVAINEIDPSTMQSKKANGLYFVGEVLDLDAYTGGFNLQIAWSTGYLAGLNIG